MIALLVQGALLAVSVFVVVKEDAPAPTVEFEATRVVDGETRQTEERRESVRQLQKRMSRPRTFQPIAVESEMRGELPALPELPVDALGEDLDEGLFAEQAESMMSEAGLLSFAGALSGSRSAAEFFGVRDEGSRIVIVVNTSASVVRKAAARGVSIERIQDEVAGMVDGLETGALFGVVQFSQGVNSFSEQLAPALGWNRRLAAAWIREELRGNPPVVEGALVGHEAAFAAALELRPDLVFLVTDGSLNRRTAKAGGGWSYPKISFEELMGFVDRKLREVGASPRLHVIGFELGEKEKEGLERLARRYGGTLREM